MAAKKKKEAKYYDAFISYSRRNRDFAVKLEKALENYKPPKIAQDLKKKLPINR